MYYSVSHTAAAVHLDNPKTQLYLAIGLSCIIIQIHSGIFSAISIQSSIKSMLHVIPSVVCSSRPKLASVPDIAFHICFKPLPTDAHKHCCCFDAMQFPRFFLNGRKFLLNYMQSGPGVSFPFTCSIRTHSRSHLGLIFISALPSNVDRASAHAS